MLQKTRLINTLAKQSINPVTIIDLSKFKQQRRVPWLDELPEVGRHLMTIQNAVYEVQTQNDNDENVLIVAFHNVDGQIYRDYFYMDSTNPVRQSIHRNRFLHLCDAVGLSLSSDTVDTDLLKGHQVFMVVEYWNTDDADKKHYRNVTAYESLVP